MKQIRNWFIGDSSTLLTQVIRYFFSSGFSFVIDFSILWLLTSIFNLHYLISTPIAYLMGMVINYITSDLWVFRGRSIKNPKHIEFTIFLSIGMFGLLMNQGMMWLFTEKVGLFYIYSRLVSALINYIIKFWARKKMIFNKI
ncbi:GtrA family protein [Spirochaeta cellobiosiphila]|uniref:GtrA family protein n=1 Tax=Spirochaeta cellobiosiphila TaxID=504483 RepID=UPI00048B3907|nr:GtrA family protein [Spirochaeta cellobiosiphila]